MDQFLAWAEMNKELLATFIALLLSGDALFGFHPKKKYVGFIKRAFSLTAWLYKAVKKKNVASLIFVCILLAGCAHMSQSKVCETSEQSLICERIPSPEAADIILQLANLEAVKHDVYRSEQALQFLDECETYLVSVDTYSDLCQWVAAKVNRLEIELFVLSRHLDTLDVSAPISEYDRYLLQKHIEHHREILLLYIGGSNA